MMWKKGCGHSFEDGEARFCREMLAMYVLAAFAVGFILGCLVQ